MNIFVGSFPLETSEDDLRKAFAEFGDVFSVQIIKDRVTGDSRGFAFVEMRSKREAQMAIDELNGKEFMGGQPLTVNEARPRPVIHHGGPEHDSRKFDSRRRRGKKKGSRKNRGRSRY